MLVEGRVNEGSRGGFGHTGGYSGRIGKEVIMEED